jgi:hypothetical protein
MKDSIKDCGAGPFNGKAKWVVIRMHIKARIMSTLMQTTYRQNKKPPLKRGLNYFRQSGTVLIRIGRLISSSGFGFCFQGYCDLKRAFGYRILVCIIKKKRS